MLKYLVIQLDDTSVSYCHYKNDKSEKNLIPLSVLNDAIIFAMKNNLLVQVVYPRDAIPQEYQTMVDSIYHSSIVPVNCKSEQLVSEADIVVIDKCAEISSVDFGLFLERDFVLKTSFSELNQYKDLIYNALSKLNRLNIIISDIENLSKNRIEQYQYFLSELTDKIYCEYSKGHQVQTNLLTDRIVLNTMNNCEAGSQSAAVAPDGKLYACPAFYLSDTAFSFSIGDVMKGIVNADYSNLCNIQRAPICRICEAWQCKRCVWLNSRTTLELNTPSREQCLISHIERNESKNLLDKLNTIKGVCIEAQIPSIDYFDPLEKILKQK